MSQTPPPDVNLGRMLGDQYRLDALLGEGGMGRVYRGMQLSVNRAVAIKLIAGSPPHPAEWEQRFRREAEATARLSHPNSVRLFDFGITKALELYIVMELLQGSDLACHMEQHGPLPLEFALRVTRQVLCALAEAHALGIVHRDLKPDNVYLAAVRGGETVAKVMDFGIAGIAQAQRSTKLTLTGTVLGTPAYMSPEQAQGRTVDARSDLYSLGVMLFEMVSGRTPFEADTAVSLLLAHVTQPPKRLSDVGVRMPRQADVQALLDRLLAKDTADRPASANATLEALDALAAPAPTAKSVVDATSAPSKHSSRAHATVLASEIASRESFVDIGRGRVRQRALLIGVGVLIIATGVLALRWQPGSRAAAGAPAPSSAAADAIYKVTIASIPNGASVMLDGAELGKTPYSFRFKRETELSLTRRGYLRETVHVSPDSEPTLVVDLVRDKARTDAEPTPLAEAAPQPAADNIGKAEPRAPVLQPSAADTNPPPSAATETARSAARDPQPPRGVGDGLGDYRTPSDEPGSPRRHRVRDAVAHFFGRLLGGGGAAERARRQALLNEPLPYPSFAAAERAYSHREIAMDRYEDVLWLLRERRKQRIDLERDKLARGMITRSEYEAQLDQIGAEFRGQ